MDVLLENGAGLSEPVAFGPPLHLACLLGSKTLVQQMFGKGANANETGGYFEHALFAALAIQQSDIMKKLLEHGANTRILHQDLGTPLHLAGKLGNVASVKELLRHGANVMAPDSDGRLSTAVAASMMESRQQRGNDYCERKQAEASLSALREAEKKAVVLRAMDSSWSFRVASVLMLREA